MTWWRQRPFRFLTLGRVPTSRTSAALTRLRSVVVVLAALAVSLGALGFDPARPDAVRNAGYGAVVVLLITFATTSLRRDVPAWEWPIVGLTLMVIGSALHEPLLVAVPGVAVVATQSLYGTTKTTAARGCAVLAAVLVAIVSDYWITRYLQPAPPPAIRLEGWRWLVLVGVVPALAAVAVAVRALNTLVSRHGVAIRREAILVRANGQLIDETDFETVTGTVRAAVEALCELPPGYGVISLRRSGDSMVVTDQIALPIVVNGVTLPMSEPTDLAVAAPLATPPKVAVGNDTESRVRWLPHQSRLLDSVLGERRYWRALEPPSESVHDLLVIGGFEPVPDEMVESLRALTTSQVLAEAQCATHAELVHLAHHDQLTGLANRTLFINRLGTARIEGRPPAAVLVVDLDDFRQINDAYGHDAGDKVLVAVADELRRCAGEHALIARTAGDEFAIAVDPAMSPDRLARRIVERLKDPVAVQHAPGCCVGIAVADPSLTGTDLLRRADTAANAAKAAGKHHIEHFIPGRHGNMTEIRLIERHLPNASARGEIVVFYQPHIDLRTRRCVGVEALARWLHPTLGMVPPARFIPLAERTGQIAAIGAHVLRTACKQVADWSVLPGCENLQVAVNVAAPQLYDHAFVNLVSDALDRGGLPARRLTLELTESGAVDNERAHERINTVAALGVRVSVDDFGTGYASLATLSTITAHQVKIDRTFISGGDRQRGMRMVQLIVASGKILNLEVVAEGVETEQQATDLLHAGVPLAQGYLFARPMPAEDFPMWLADQVAQTRPAASEQQPEMPGAGVAGRRPR